MPEIHHRDLDHFLKNLSPADEPPVVLVFGEPYLAEKAFDKIVDRVLPPKARALGYELLEGEDLAMSVIIDRLTTFSMMQDKKVVALKESPLFGGAQASVGTAYLPKETVRLQELIEKGIPQGHHLFITASKADKRRTLYKTIKARGLIVDCSVPSGSRQADLKAQQAVMGQITAEILGPRQKRMEPGAAALLMDHIGFDPVTLSSQLEKLADFTADRPMIGVEDVRTLVRRTKKDAVFELTNAAGAKDLENALFYLNTLLSSGFHPLQIVVALANQMRKLLLVKAVLEKAKGEGRWVPSRNMDFSSFTRQVLPIFLEADQMMMEKSKEIPLELETNPEKKPNKKSDKKKKKGGGSDLLIAPNPKNSYPVFHTFLKSTRFSLNELVFGLTKIHMAEADLKSSGGDPSLVLENLLMGLCVKGEQNG